MDDFLKKIIKGNGTIPPTACKLAFNELFHNASNVEWCIKDNNYEAVFYKESLEHIALFDLSGNLIEYRKFVPVPLLPHEIKTFIESKGEIMNAVLKNKRNSIEYEVIFRNNQHKRYLILLTDTGEVIEEKEL